nr:MAG TPA: hypothetical protein [Bacteriophage sp.]
MGIIIYPVLVKVGSTPTIRSIKTDMLNKGLK